jgi:hypothetical protein
MPRFFFHVCEMREGGNDVSRDTEGQDFPDLEAARREAINVSREMLGEKILHGGALDHRRIEISNEKGEVLAVVDARDTLFQEGQLRSFNDDVTQSAPKGNPSKPDAR